MTSPFSSSFEEVKKSDTVLSFCGVGDNQKRSVCLLYAFFFFLEIQETLKRRFKCGEGIEKHRLPSRRRWRRR